MMVQKFNGAIEDEFLLHQPRIALTGKMRSGKDTVGLYLIQRGLRHYKLSDGISRIISQFFYDDIECGKKMRTHYTHIGQSMRALDPEVWCKYTWNQISKDNHLAKAGVLITDLRQKNEEKFLRDRGFNIIKIESSEEIRLERAKELDSDFQDDLLSHETELSVDDIDYDYLIKNDGTLEELYEQVKLIYNQLIN